MSDFSLQAMQDPRAVMIQHGRDVAMKQVAPSTMVDQVLSALESVISQLDGAFGDLQGRINPILSAPLDTPLREGIKTGVNDSSCIIAQVLHGHIMDLERITERIRETTNRVEC